MQGRMVRLFSVRWFLERKVSPAAETSAAIDDFQCHRKLKWTIFYIPSPRILMPLLSHCQTEWKYGHSIYKSCHTKLNFTFFTFVTFPFVRVMSSRFWHELLSALWSLCVAFSQTFFLSFHPHCHRLSELCFLQTACCLRFSLANITKDEMRVCIFSPSSAFLWFLHYHEI